MWFSRIFWHLYEKDSDSPLDSYGQTTTVAQKSGLLSIPNYGEQSFKMDVKKILHAKQHNWRIY